MTTRKPRPNLGHYRLTQKHVTVLTSVVRFDILSPEQAYRLHFREAKHVDSAKKALEYLSGRGLLAEMKSHSETRDGQYRKAKRSWYCPQKCHRPLLNTLNTDGYYDVATELEGQLRAFNKSLRFRSDTVHHELGLSDILLAFEEHATAQPAVAGVGWVRTSLGHELTNDIKVTFNFKHDDKVMKQTRPINPDVLLWLKLTTGSYRFFIVEFENDTSTPKIYRRKKLRPYSAYHSQGLFAELCARLSDAFDLNIATPKRFSFQLLTISKSADHMSKLFTNACLLNTDSLFLFSHLDAVLNDPFGSCWLSKKQFGSTDIEFTAPDPEDEEGELVWDSYLAKYRELAATAPEITRYKWAREHVDIKRHGAPLLQIRQ